MLAYHAENNIEYFEIFLKYLIRNENEERVIDVLSKLSLDNTEIATKRRVLNTLNREYAEKFGHQPEFLSN